MHVEGEESAPAKPRISERARVKLPATLETLNGLKRVHLLNLSPEGAMIEIDDPPAVGGDAVLRRGEIDAFGVIVWAGSGRCGMTFDEPIPEVEILRQKRTSAIIGQMPVSPEEIAATRDWAEGR